VRICVLIKSEGSTRDTFCDTLKRADGQMQRDETKKKSKAEERDAWTKINFSSFSPSADEEKTKKTHTRTPLRFNTFIRLKEL
jgi:hypothetical protein